MSEETKDQTPESTPNTTNDETPEQSLEDFASELFGDSKEAPDNAKSEETTEEEAEVSGEQEEQETDTQTDDPDEEVVSEDDDTLATDEDEDTDKETDTTNDPKPKKKNRFQERIDELTAARKEAERKVEALATDYQKQIDELKAQLEKQTEPTSPEKDQEALKAPSKDDLTEDGKPKYPLGEYDPQFMRDTVEHMFAQKEAEQEAKQADLRQQDEITQAQQALQGEWNTKLESARERYPDFQEKGEQMLTVFEGIDEQYGEYLTTTLMEMENGPDVFYYLANNVEEAQSIVNRGPKQATMELAKLEAQLAGKQQKETPKPKVTKAKTPPPQNKGSAPLKPRVAQDTDDLDAFSKELFRSK